MAVEHGTRKGKIMGRFDNRTVIVTGGSRGMGSSHVRLPLEQKVRPTWLPGYAMAPGRPAGKIEIPAGPATIGARFDDLPFGWDNEFPAVQAAVPAFRIDGTPVTNGQYLAFVEDGGYRRAELWGDEDWLWRGHEAMEHPVVWELLDGRWRY